MITKFKSRKSLEKIYNLSFNSLEIEGIKKPCMTKPLCAMLVRWGCGEYGG